MYKYIHIYIYNVAASLILGPPNNWAPEKSKLDILNKCPTVLRVLGGLGDYFERDGLDSVPYV